MNSANSIKRWVFNFFTVVILICLATSCSSVADANLDLPEPDTSLQVNGPGSEDDPWYNSNGDDMDPIIPRPPNPGL